MGESSNRSAYGDPEARRRQTLDAAAALLDEGGYTALTIRSVAKRAGISVGLIYQYFVDKHDLFITLLNESQVESRSFVAALPRDQGVAALLAQIMPEAARQWGRVGRFAATWRDIEGEERARRESIHEVRRTAKEYNDTFHAALREAAAAEGQALRRDPAVLPFVLSTVQGVSDTIVHRWAPELDPAELIEFTSVSLSRTITVPAGAPEHGE
ncbi:TetR/AcrR family transcriptional regulator [Actinocorallia populi]|uniref:TetR/AcrR family transcriptional regulator n=1 Tax=Actinocorallia populi TaxID=2079200 RepID=UPI000D08B255|nr:TetR/AcrR family transcriptional regulator [Actinocorallia populi]